MSETEARDQPARVLVPIEERAVDFYGDTIPAFLVDIAGGSSIYVPVRPLCDYLGLSWSGQYERLQRDEVLRESLEFVRMIRTNSPGNPNVVCLPLELLPGWLFGIDAGRMRGRDAALVEQKRAKVQRYRRECFGVLWRAFQADVLSSIGQTPAPATVTTTLAQVRNLGLAVVQLAEQQMALETRVTGGEERLDRAAQVVGELRRRVTVLEDRLQPKELITEEQAVEVSAQVKALAELLTGKEAGKNFYQGIFGELYRRYGVSSYHKIHLGQYAAILRFLDDWRAAALGATTTDPPVDEV